MSTIVIPGRLTKNAEVKQGQSGSFVTFSVAEDVRVKGEKKSQFFDCTWNGKRAEAVVQYLTKGTPVTVSGSLGTREYNGKTYLTVNTNDVSLQGSKGGGGGGGSSGGYGSPAGGSAKHSAPADDGPADDFGYGNDDSDVPF